MTRLKTHAFFHFWLACLMACFLGSCAHETELNGLETEMAADFDVRLSDALDLAEEHSPTALQRLDQIIADAESLDSRYYAGKAKWYKAYIYDDILGEVPLAYSSYKDALKDVLLTEDASLKMKVYTNLGLLERFYGRHDAAIENYRSALELSDDLTIREVSDLYYNLGVALKLRGDSSSFFRAEQAFTAALEHAQQIDYEGNIASVYNQIGLMYKAMGNYDMARIAYNNTIKTYVEDPDMQNYVGKAYHGIGVTYMDQNNDQASVRAFKKALEYKTQSGSIFITKYDLGTVLMRSGRIDEAIATWKEALNEKHSKDDILQVQIYSDLTKALKMTSNFEAALNYSEIYNETIKNILKEEEKYKAQSDQILFANVVNQYEEFDKTPSLLARPLVLLVSILGLIGLAYVLIALYYRSKAKRKVSETISKLQADFMDMKVD